MNIEELQEILKEIRENTSDSINLTHKQIGDAGAESIARALKINNSIINLSLNSNQIGDSGIIAIAESLKINNSITSLDIGDIDADESKRLVINLLEYNFSLTKCYINFKNADLVQEKNNILKRNKKIPKVIKSFKDFISNNSPYFSISKYLFLEKIISSLKEKEERNDYSPVWYKEFVKIRKKIKETWFSQLTYVSEQSLYDENSPFFYDARHNA